MLEAPKVSFWLDEEAVAKAEVTVLGGSLVLRVAGVDIFCLQRDGLSQLLVQLATAVDLCEAYADPVALRAVA
jgi:hypothetical protein